jgi:hypothetical protein
MVHALRAVRALPAFPRRHQLPHARRDRDAAEILLHRLGEIHLLRHRRAGNRADAAPPRRAHHVPLFHAAPDLAHRQGVEEAATKCAIPKPASSKSNAFRRAVRAGLDGADHAGLARSRGAQQMVLRQRPEAVSSTAGRIGRSSITSPCSGAWPSSAHRGW